MAPPTSTRSPRLPTEADLERLSPGNRLAVAAAFVVAQERGLLRDGTTRARIVGPQTDEELLDAVEELTGYHIPRVSVCVEHGHVAPAKTFCDLYFERVRNVLWIGNRGGGKTTNSGFLHGAKAAWNPDYKSALAGAMQAQSQRGYAELKRFCRLLGDQVLDTLLSRTNWANGSFNEVLGGTVKQVNGPHPHLAQFDELELSTLEVFEEFLNMAQGDARYAAQQLLTSTRKKAHGLVQKIFKESKDAEDEGREAPWRCDIFCIFETIRNQPGCRSAPENQGRPEEELCQCHKIVKGEWREGPLKSKPRRFDQVCAGRAYRADGHIALEDAQDRFRTLSQMVWESQVECLRPSVEGLVHKWLGDRHRLSSWEPHPAFGPIYRGWDWGGNNPHAIVWAQYLTVDVGLVEDEDTGILEPLLSDEDERPIVRVLKAGSLIQFDEIYGNADALGEFSTLGLRALMRQMQWWLFGYAIDIEQDYCDPAGLVGKREVRKAYREFAAAIDRYHALGGPDNEEALNAFDDEQRRLMADHGIDPAWLTAAMVVEPRFKSHPAPRYESIRKHIELGEDGLVYIVPAMCPRTDDEYDVYHWEDPKPGKNLPEDAAKEDDHAMDAKRYLIWGLTKALGKAPAEAPAAQEKLQPRPDPRTHPFAAPRTVPDAEAAAPVVDADEGLPIWTTGGMPALAGAAGSPRIREQGYVAQARAPR